MMTHYPTPEHTRLAAEGMYRPDLESDACGVGMVAATDGKPSRRVVEAADDYAVDAAADAAVAAEAAADAAVAVDAVADPAYDRSNWSAADLKRVEDLETAYENASLAAQQAAEEAAANASKRSKLPNK